MYRPAAFKEVRTDVMHSAIEKVGLSVLSSFVPRSIPSATPSTELVELMSSQLPLFLDRTFNAPNGALYGHFARANPQCQRLREFCATGAHPEVLAVFVADDAYISPNWYPEKKTNGGKTVPTWDYIAVQARGQLRFIDDKQELRMKVLEPLTNKHESEAAKDLGVSAWKVGDAPDRYLQVMMDQIQGFEIRITALEGSWKLSQNKSDETRRSVADALDRRGKHGIARGVRSHL